MATTLIRFSASLAISLDPSPTRSAPLTRKARFGPAIFHLFFLATFRKVARKNKWKIAGPKRAFLVSGADRVGEGSRLMAKLAEKRINVVAIDAVCAGSGRYGAI